MNQRRCAYSLAIGFLAVSLPVGVTLADRARLLEPVAGGKQTPAPGAAVAAGVNECPGGSFDAGAADGRMSADLGVGVTGEPCALVLLVAGGLVTVVRGCRTGSRRSARRPLTVNRDCLAGRTPLWAGR